MKKYFYALCMATALGAVGCSDDEVPGELDNSMKTPIQFSMTDEGGSAITKAGFMTRAGFARNTAIVMKMKSVHSTNTSDVKYTVTNAVAGAENSEKKYSAVTFANSTSGINQRYWDDAHGRNSQLSIFAVAVPNQPTASSQLTLKGGTTTPWFTDTDENLKIDWKVTNTGTTAGNIDEEDLVYSNNIQDESTERGVVKWDFATASYTEYTGEDFTTKLEAGTMQFRLKEAGKTEGPGKFDTGHLNFKHALSRVTLNIKAADGFSTADYADGKVKEVHLNNVPYKGTFNVQDGAWTVTTTGDVDLVKEAAPETNYNLKYTGQIVPEYVIHKDKDDVNMLQFTINNNVYYVTDAMVHTALDVTENASLLDKETTSDNIVMKPGKNYVLNITVNKTKIENITATLANWLPVTGNHTQNNAYLKFENFFVDKGSPCDKFDLYRIENKSPKPSTTDGEYQAKNWYSGYSTSERAELTPNPAGSNTWKTNWYFESNTHFYHFRTVNRDTKIKAGTEATEPKDYFEIKTGTDADCDYHWGAPMTPKGGDPKYDQDKGYEDFISYAIGATESTIKLQEFHMMSQVDIVLTTTSGADKVSLYDEETKTGTTVKITNIFQNGKVEMGRGLVSKTGDRSSYVVKSPETTSADTYYQTKPVDGTTPAVSKVYKSLVVPQSLTPDAGGADVYVGLEIQTPDKNMYYVVKKLSEITAGVTGADNGYNHTNGTAITRWYPGHHYTYTLTLKKTGIDKITCSLADWKKITGSSDVTLED